MLPVENVSRSWSHRLTDAYIFIMLTAFPLFTGVTGYLYLGLKKFFFFLLFTMLWLSGLLVCLAVRCIKLRRIVKPRQTDWYIIGFLLVAAASTIHSSYGVLLSTEIGRYDSLLTYLLYGVILLSISHYGQEKRYYLYAFAFSYTLCCVVALLQLFGWNALWLYPDQMNYHDPYVLETGVFLGTMGNIDIFSALHCIAIPIFIGSTILGRRKNRFFLLIPVFLGLTTLIAAGVASGILALSVTMILSLPAICAIKHQERTGKKLPRWFLFSGLLILLSALALFFYLPLRSGTLFEIQRVIHGEFRDEYGSSRIRIWKEVIEVYRNNVFLGIGPGTLDYYLDIRFERYSELLGEILFSYVDNAHNEYLQLLVSFGLLGFIPFCILLLDTWYGILSNLEQSKTLQILAPAFLCYLIQAFFNIGNIIVVPIFFILWGFILNGVYKIS